MYPLPDRGNGRLKGGNTDRYTLFVTRGEQLDRQILGAVGRTLYAEGINSTGVDRLSAAAGVSKRTLYQRYASKDGLIVRALDMLDEPVHDSLVEPGRRAAEAGATPVEQIVAVFADIERRAGERGFRGCPFLNAGVELVDPSHSAHLVIRRHKERLRKWFEATAKRGGLDAPAELSRQLLVLFDGALMGSCVVPDGEAALSAQGAARALLDRSAPENVGVGGRHPVAHLREQGASGGAPEDS